jgi:hypothetical protein
MFGLSKKIAKQQVCTVCGYNIVGSRPARCPFCSAPQERIVDSTTISRRYKVSGIPISDTVSQLRCAPKLGLEHAAYRIQADGGSIWIDCPAVFDTSLSPVDAIFFTHKDFIGAANQYKALWDCEVWLHSADAEISEVSRHSVDHNFDAYVEKFGVKGIHIGGHSPGFTIYIWEDVLFVCDYAYPPGKAMKLNPHGKRDATREGACRLADAVSGLPLSTVCGYNYVVRFGDWYPPFMRLL